MYCLTPPISEPPEGSWSCHLCIEQYHKPKGQKESSGKNEEEEKMTEKEKQEKPRTEEIDKQIVKNETNGKETPTKDENLKLVEDVNCEKSKLIDHGKQLTDKKTTLNQSDKEKKIDKPIPIIEEKLKSILEEKKRENESKC